MVGGAAGGAMAGMLIASNIARLNAGLKTAKETWPALAADGLVLSESETGRPVLKGEVDGIAVGVAIVTDAVRCAYTHVVAMTPARHEVTVGLYPQPPGVLGKLRSLIGQDIELGDETFDQAFLIHGKPESAAHKLLVPELRGPILELLAHNFCAFDYEPGKVTVQLGRLETEVDALRKVIQVAVAAAKGSPR